MCILLQNSTFDITEVQNTLLGLQHDFCALWNEITQASRIRIGDVTAYHILGSIRDLYVALHPGTDVASNYVPHQPPSYPLCEVPGHDSHNVTGDNTHPTNTSPHAPPPDVAVGGASPAT
jgi:hypothetical protein